MTKSYQSVDLHEELSRGFTARYIRSKSRQLLNRGKRQQADIQDVEQELAMAVVQAYPSFDPAVADWRSFAATVIERTAGQIHTHRTAQKRQDGHAVVSLNTTVPDSDGGEPTSLATQIGAEHREACTGRYASSDVELTDLAEDVQGVISTLATEDQKVCRLMLDHPQREAAKENGTSRRSLRDAINRIRRKFRGAGFGKNSRKNHRPNERELGSLTIEGQ